MTLGSAIGMEGEETGGTGAEVVTNSGMMEGRGVRPKLVASWKDSMTSGSGMGMEGEETGGTGTEGATPGGITEGRDVRPKLVASWNEDLWCKVLVVVVIRVVGKRVVRLIPGVG